MGELHTDIIYIYISNAFDHHNPNNLHDIKS